MIINQILGNIENSKWHDYLVDTVEFDWYELNKRILRKTTSNNLDLGINLLEHHSPIRDGDVLSHDQNSIIVVSVKKCECIAITVTEPLELARFCYEIGNRHAALFIDENDNSTLLLAMDRPLLQMLEKIGAKPKTVEARLIKSLSGNIAKSNHHH